ncbi:MAG TPA: hypothetical protein QGG37_06580 [Chloroflexota bacterium]|nr:hypothetical protein [Chloroflexota bacterium]
MAYVLLDLRRRTATEVVGGHRGIWLAILLGSQHCRPARLPLHRSPPAATPAIACAGFSKRYGHEFLAATGLYVLYGALGIAWTCLMSSLVNSGIGAGGLALVPLLLIPTLSLLSGRLGDFLPFDLIVACALAAHAHIRAVSF